MHDSVCDPISAIPAREHMKQESDNPLAHDPPLRWTVQRSITVAEAAERARQISVGRVAGRMMLVRGRTRPCDRSAEILRS